MAGPPIKELLTTSKLLVVDLDGTIFNTEPFHLRSYELIVSALLPVDVELTYEDIVGMTEPTIWQDLIRRYGLAHNPERLNRLRQIVLAGLLVQEDLYADPIVMEIVKAFDGPRVILTARDLDSATELANRAGIAHYFERILSVQQLDVPDSKVTAIRQLAEAYGIASLGDIAWIEDASSEVAAAKDAGILTLVVRRPYNMKNAAIAHHVLGVEPAGC